MTTTLYRDLARERKVGAVVALLDKVRVGEGWSDETLLSIAQVLTDQGWHTLAFESGVRPLSAESRALVIERLAGRLA